jgi:hypothetical protein
MRKDIVEGHETAVHSKPYLALRTMRSDRGGQSISLQKVLWIDTHLVRLGALQFSLDASDSNVSLAACKEMVSDMVPSSRPSSLSSLPVGDAMMTFFSRHFSSTSV